MIQSYLGKNSYSINISRVGVYLLNIDIMLKALVSFETVFNLCVPLKKSESFNFGVSYQLSQCFPLTGNKPQQTASQHLPHHCEDVVSLLKIPPLTPEQLTQTEKYQGSSQSAL